MRHAREARRRARRRRGRQRLFVLLTASFTGVVLVLTLAGSTQPQRSSLPASSSASHAAAAIAPTLQASSPEMVVPGSLAALPLPRTGESAVAVAGIGLVASSRDERSVPVASLTKIMTAYIILRDHPLPGDSDGPTFVMDKADWAAWVAASEADESNLEVRAGERLDERQLLQALLIPSADNIADYLAVWDAGRLSAFVAKMNSEAVKLGLSATHFADASGVNPHSRSDAVDMARLASIAMQNPTFRWVVDEQSIKLPVAGSIWNADNPAIGVDGIVGVKSGYTSAAQTNLVTAAWRHVKGHRVLVVSVVLDQPTSMGEAAQEDEGLLQAVTPDLRVVQVEPANAVVGEALTSWGSERAPVAVRSPLGVIGWPGLTLTTQLVPVVATAGVLAHGWDAGSTVGTLDVEYPYGPAASEPANVLGRLEPPPPGWQPPRLAG